MYLLLVFTIILSLLLIIFIIINFTQTPNHITSDVNYILFNSTNSISIISNNYNDNLKEYAKSWGYIINGTETDYILYLNDNISDINLNKNLGDIINIAINSEYIFFLDSDSFITRDKSINNKQILLEHLEKDCILSENVIREIISSGYPYRTYNGIILNRSYLDNIFQNKSDSYNEIKGIVPSYISPRVTSNITTKIPKIIHQTFSTHLLPNVLLNAIKTWIDRNPEYEYRYYDDGDQRKFIEKHFDERVLKAYDKLIPGAYRADLWRYCVVYINGGVYVDIKMGAKFPLYNIIHPDTEMIFINDEPRDALYNAFFASIPQNPLLYDLIIKCVINIENEYYGESYLDPVGPVAMGKHIIYELGYKDHLPLDKTTTSHGVIQVYELSYDLNGNTRNIKLPNSDPIIKMRNTSDINDPKYLYKITGIPHYGILWKENKIYRKVS